MWQILPPGLLHGPTVWDRNSAYSQRAASQALLAIPDEIVGISHHIG